MKTPLQTGKEGATAESNQRPKGGDLVERLVGHIASMAEHQRQRENGKLCIDSLAELKRIRASIGAIHYHAKRVSREDAAWMDMYVVLRSIRDEAEECIPELHNLSNTKATHTGPEGAGDSKEKL